MKAIMILMFIFSSTAFAHSGRTNSDGCHNDYINGGYHCHHHHKDKLAKITSLSKTEKDKTLQAGKKKK